MFGRDENVRGHEEERGGVKAEVCVSVDDDQFELSQIKECIRSVLVFEVDSACFD